VLKSSCPIFAFLLGGAALAGFSLWKVTTSPQRVGSPSSDRIHESGLASSDSPCAIALTAHQGDEQIDIELRNLQMQAHSATKPGEIMKRLGWVYVRKARLSYDSGYYKLAEQCSLCAQSENPDDADAMLLRGHILHSLHQFKKAESIARKLVALRNRALDQGLLGDVLMEQGRLDEAVASYQKMVNLRPDLQSYTRVGHMRWLRGDLSGAIEVLEMAVTAGSPREAEATAWAHTRLGIYELQAGNIKGAAGAAWMALQLVENYAAALLLQGRVLLAQGKVPEAIDSLQRAAIQSPLPEYQWTLADAMREAGRLEAAQEVERNLIGRGANDDPRTFALYLLTRSQRAGQALALIEQELKTRTDIFTLDALAWALKANGRLVEAHNYSEQSLNQGTRDARLFYHAASIALAMGNHTEAQELFNRADEIRQMLMPSEREDLNQQIVALGARGKSPAITQ
jgi:tetratricopeptide (TPR) repeat protein